MNRPTQHVLLLLVGGALLKIALNGTFVRYVKPSHQWLLVAAGAVILVLAATALARDLHGHAVGHDHEHTVARSPWLLLLPVLAIFLVAPPALGSDAVNRASDRNAVAEPARHFPPLPPGDAPALKLGEFVTRAVWEPRSLEGRDVTLIGFVAPLDGTPALARMSIACCAADAQALKVRMSGGGVEQVATDVWVRVRASYRAGSADGPGRVPSIDVRSFEVIPAPSIPYEL